ncbi:MAG: class I SAM-dependent methyltransferase [Bacteroidales bacterium]|nr:class I SAM-dependent methyltransferase [Bacteroidales bacterium]MBK7628630.1 class I SAM-dependent methyltransferase [Bacteroidales bacterium]
MNEFDVKAAEWDKNPMHWDRSEAIANEIKKLIPLNNKMKALEYGAGTGITSFLLKDHLREIILMDNSTEMVRIMNEKIEASKVKNMTALNFDLEHNDYRSSKFDIIFTQMVLHHVMNIDAILGRFQTLLNPGGYLAIADLFSEDGSFHGEGFEGHNGFDVEDLSGKLDKHNFKKINHKECFVINRKISDSVTRNYPVFIMTGFKPAS